jgi:flagellar basal body-associated protein FliL
MGNHKKVREFTLEETKKLKKSQNIILVVLVLFVLLNIGIFMWFMLTQTL